MKTDKNISGLIRKLFGGKIASSEISELNSWYNSFDRNEDLIIESAETKEAVKNRMLQKLLHGISKPKSTGLKLVLFHNNYWKAAAAITTIFILSLSLYVLNNVYFNKIDKIAWIEKKTGMGEKIEVVMADGSKITVNAGSKIKYQANSYAGMAREVFMEGEAFFDVVHNDKKPFIVHATNISIKDIGTKFDVKKYKGEDETLVSLVEGKVEVSILPSMQENKPQKKYLALKQQLSYKSSNQSININEFNEREALGWMDNTLVFKKLPLNEAAVYLERNYGVKFEFPDNSIQKKELTANFQNESYSTVAEAIKKLTGHNYKTVEENKRITKLIFY